MAGDRKSTLAEEKYNATNFLTLWDFEGVFKYSPLFYGWYTNLDSNHRGYRLPFAYFVTGLVVYAYSFFATLRKMAENSRMSKLSEKDDECIFSWKLFTAWDYMIGNAETAHNRVASIVMGFKEALLEEAEKKRESRNWKVIFFRILVNTVVVGLLCFSAFAVIMVVKRSTEPEANLTVWRKNEITIVISTVTTVFPMLFEVLGFLEQYHPRKQLRIQLARIMVLNLLNLYSLIFALFDKISDMTNELQEFENLTKIVTTTTSDYNVGITSIPLIPETTECHTVCDNDEVTKGLETTTSSEIIANFVYNISTTAYTKITTSLIPNSENASSDSSVIDYFTTTSTSYDNITAAFTNNTSIYENVTDFLGNVTYTSDMSFFNQTPNNDIDINFDDLANSGPNYMDGSLFEDSTKINSTDFNSTSEDDNNSTYYYDNNTDITTELTTELTTPFELFESTTPNITNRFEDGIYEQEEGLEQTSTTIKTFTESQSTDLTTSITENCRIKCKSVTNRINENITTQAPIGEVSLNYTARARLRMLCWETMFGQELIKLTVMDLILTVLTTLAWDFFRGLFVRFMNRCWCWDLEKRFPQYGDFKVAENILHLVNNQGMVWMGMFFSPGLVVMNIVKLYLMMYFRAWAVLTCNVPHEIIFRASRSNNFYYALLLMMLFLCVLPVGYAIVWIKPSWHCGPFSEYTRIFHIFTKTIRANVPEALQRALDYIASPGIVIPLLVLLILIIYYLISLTGALREANNDLKIQLRRERTEERRKMFQMADRRRRGGSSGSNELSNTPFNKWKKLLGRLPSGKSFDETPKQELEEEITQIKELKLENKNKDFFAKFIKKALGKSSTSDEEQNADTDTEQHDSLPMDAVEFKKSHKQLKKSISSGSNDLPILVQKALIFRKMEQAKRESSQAGSTDSSETKKVPPLKSESVEVNKNDLGNNRNYKKKLVDRPSTSKDMRQDSGSSIWSDNIPVITISKTKSTENILDETITKSVVKHSQETLIHKNKKQENKVIEEEPKKFKPKIKCVLKKQSSEIDEDVICHFGDELERRQREKNIIKAVAEEELDYNYYKIEELPKDQIFKEPEMFKIDDIVSDKTSSDQEGFKKGKFLKSKSSSEDTIKDASGDTILNLPYASEIKEKEEKEEKETDVSPKGENNSSGSAQTESSSDYNDVY